MTTKTGIIYLQREKFQIYSPYLPNVLEFRFVPELIRDFDLVNRQLLENLLKVFISNNKIPPSSMVIVIADSASFMKDFVSPPPIVSNPQQPPAPPPTLEDLQNLANEYLDHVPFEMIGSKIFPLATGVRAYATNQEMYDSLKIILEKQGFIVQTVLPGFVFGPNLSNRPMLDGVSVNEILQKLSTLQGYNLLKGSPMVPESVVSEGTEEKEESSGEANSPLEKLEKPENKKVVVSAAISIIVIVVLITAGIMYSQFTVRPYTPPPPVQQSAASPTAVPQVTQAVNLTEVKDLTVQIVSPSSEASSAAALRTEFTTLGVKSVIPQTQESLDSSSNLLIFSPKVSSQVKSVVTNNVKKIVPDIIIQERADASFDITVILGK